MEEEWRHWRVRRRNSRRVREWSAACLRWTPAALKDRCGGPSFTHAHRTAPLSKIAPPGLAWPDRPAPRPCGLVLAAQDHCQQHQQHCHRPSPSHLSSSHPIRARGAHRHHHRVSTEDMSRQPIISHAARTWRAADRCTNAPRTSTRTRTRTTHPIRCVRSGHRLVCSPPRPRSVVQPRGSCRPRPVGPRGPLPKTDPNALDAGPEQAADASD